MEKYKSKALFHDEEYVFLEGKPLFEESAPIYDKDEPTKVGFMYEKFAIYYKDRVAYLKKTPREILAEEIAKKMGPETNIKMREKDYA